MIVSLFFRVMGLLFCEIGSHWLEWAEDGSLLACTSSSSIKIYDNREKKVVKTLYKHIRGLTKFINQILNE